MHVCVCVYAYLYVSYVAFLIWHSVDGPGAGKNVHIRMYMCMYMF